MKFSVANIFHFKQQALRWASTFNVSSYLDNNNHQQSSFDCLIASGIKTELISNENSFEQLKEFFEKEKSWLCGFMTYDLKNQIEKLKSENPDGIGMPGMYFFKPEILIRISSPFSSGEGSGVRRNAEIEITAADPANVFAQINSFSIRENSSTTLPIKVNHRISKDDYLKKVACIREHIIEGDVYELNLCQEFFAENCDIEPLQVFEKLNSATQNPFACFLKLKDKFLICSSPERFLKKEGSKLISQPIKGTIRRGKNEQEDDQLKNELHHSEKEQAENVMIVDLVRNDLARSCKPGSVKVEELFGVHSFRNVHHLISTLSGELRNEVHFVDAIKNAFPMGSMTGAPKIKAMELIEHYEETKRGLFSGSVGYITPEGDFDFNVVIRSILYNQSKKYLSFQTGGAIVYDSVPEKEYEETMLKAGAMLKALSVTKSD